MCRSVEVLQKTCQDFEVVVADDASQDDTAKILQELQQEYPQILRVITHAENKGIAFTFEELYRAAQKDFFLLIPGDAQYPPELLVECMPLLQQYDIIICRRAIKTYTVYRHIVSQAYRWLPRILFGVDLYDSGSVKCMRRSIVDDVHVQSTSVFVEAERVIRAAKMGYSIGVVDFIPMQRQAGKAQGAKLSIVWSAFIDMLKFRFSK